MCFPIVRRKLWHPFAAHNFAVAARCVNALSVPEPGAVAFDAWLGRGDARRHGCRSLNRQGASALAAAWRSSSFT